LPYLKGNLGKGSDLMRRFVILACVTLSLSACSDKGLRTLVKPGDGPDEFGIVPNKPLQAPPSYSQLPKPTPGGANLTDQTPLQDSVIVLGGRPSTKGIAQSDAALISHSTRLGVSADIRAQLTNEDEDFRRRRGRFTNIKIVKVDNYFNVYRHEALDAEAEHRRWRRAGVHTPSAPPN
jgi:hypothetical protein